MSKTTGLPLEAPEINVPEHYSRLWYIYFSVSNQVSRIHDGSCGRIPPSEWWYWKLNTGTEISEAEYSLLVDMDEAYCIAMNKVLKEIREAELEKAKKND